MKENLSHDASVFGNNSLITEEANELKGKQLIMFVIRMKSNYNSQITISNFTKTEDSLIGTIDFSDLDNETTLEILN